MDYIPAMNVGIVFRVPNLRKKETFKKDLIDHFVVCLSICQEPLSEERLEIFSWNSYHILRSTASWFPEKILFVHLLKKTYGNANNAYLDAVEGSKSKLIGFKINNTFGWLRILKFCS